MPCPTVKIDVRRRPGKRPRRVSTDLTLLAVADIPLRVPYEPRLHVVLHQPEIPPNTGAVGRTCVAIGAKLWLVRPLGFRVDEKTLRRAGLDYWQFLEWEVVDDWAALTRRLPMDRGWYFTKTATHSYLDVTYQTGDILVFGSETAGLPPTLLEQHRDRTLRIPIRSEVRSLNLSNSVAVAAYEAVRQWRQYGLMSDAE